MVVTGYNFLSGRFHFNVSTCHIWRFEDVVQMTSQAAIMVISKQCYKTLISRINNFIFYCFNSNHITILNQYCFRTCDIENLGILTLRLITTWSPCGDDQKVVT